MLVQNGEPFLFAFTRVLPRWTDRDQRPVASFAVRADERYSASTPPPPPPKLTP